MYIFTKIIFNDLKNLLLHQKKNFNTSVSFDCEGMMIPHLITKLFRFYVIAFPREWKKMSH